MQRLSRYVLLLHSDASFRERLKRAVPEHQEVREIPDVEALRGELREGPPGTVAVVSPYDASRAELCTGLRDVLREFPSATVVAAHRFESRHYADLRTLGQWGIAELICLGKEDTRAALGRRIRTMQARPVEKVLEDALPRPLSGRARTLVAAAAETAAAGGHAPELAAALDLTERTLLRWCARAAVPPPRRLLAWLRVLLACRLLDDPGHTLASASRACGYAADMPLRRAIRNLVGRDPQELRQHGALRLAGRTFHRELQELREQARLAGRAAARVGAR